MVYPIFMVFYHSGLPGYRSFDLILLMRWSCHIAM